MKKRFYRSILNSLAELAGTLTRQPGVSKKESLSEEEICFSKRGLSEEKALEIPCLMNSGCAEEKHFASSAARKGNTLLPKTKRPRESTRQRCKRHLRGFTLIETLLSSIIALIVISFLTAFFLDAIHGKFLFQARQELEYNLQFAISQINAQVKKATRIDVVSSTLQTNPGKLVLKDSDENTITIETTGSDLKFTRAADPARSLLTGKNEITELIFRYERPNNSPGIVTGTIKMKSLLDPSLEKTETFSVTLRTNTPSP